MKFSYFFFLACVIGFCKTASNDPVAQLINRDGKRVIMLTGKRALMAHDPPSIGKTYADTFLLLLPDYNNGTIEGKDIPVRPGYYKYTGKVHIAENKLTVALSVVNTDNKNLDPLTWNGTYSLKRH